MLFNLQSRFFYFLHDFWFYLVLMGFSFILLIFASYKVYKSERSETKKKVLISLFFTLFSLITIYTGFEAYFRYRFDESDSLGFLKVNGRWMERHVVYNNFQFRDNNFNVKKTPGVTRIAVLGDSMTFGYGIKDINNRFSNILEKKFIEANHKVEVYNLGRSGYDTETEIDEYNKMKYLDFDIVIWQYFLNDAQPRDKSTGSKVLLQERKQGMLATFLSEHSYFFDYIYWRLAARYEKTFVELRNADMAAYRDKANFQRHKKEIESFIKQLKNEKRKVVVIIFPFLRFLPLYPASDIHKTMVQIFRENGLTTIDLFDDLKNKRSENLVVGRYDYHPNEFVQKIAAQHLYDTILPLLPE